MTRPLLQEGWSTLHRLFKIADCRQSYLSRVEAEKPLNPAGRDELRLVLVGDRGMLTSARIREDLQPVPGLEWITALRAPAIKKLASDGVLQLSLFDQTDLAEIAHQAFPGERLIACRNPLLAAERARKRGELMAATE